MLEAFVYEDAEVVAEVFHEDLVDLADFLLGADVATVFSFQRGVGRFDE